MVQLLSLLTSVALLSESVNALPQRASTFAGAPSTAISPPPGATITTTDTFFLDGSDVGFAGPTPTGDEANAIETAPAVAKMDNMFPLVEPNTFDNKKKTFNVLQHVGQLSPWQSVESFGLPNTSPLVPKGCSINQVHLLHRHGARYPTGDSSITSFAAKVHAAANNGSGFLASGPLSFMNIWTYKLGAEILTPFGRSQLFNLGVGFRTKYGDLLKDFTDLPVFRTTSEARMLDSALHFAAGFFGVQDYQNDYHQLIMIENDGQKNTLAPYFNCDNANNEIFSFGSAQASKWAQKYLAPTLKRLSPLIKGFNLTVTDLISMQQLCAYETVALGFSEFCDDLFSLDLDFWYANGPGNPASSAQGISYVQELVSRLTQTRITQFNSAVNSSIVSDPVVFPLNQPIFVDASYDTVMSTIFVAMNFTSLAANGPLPTDHIPKDQTYFVNQIAPFATNLVGQVLSCPASKNPTHIRWLLNDAALPLTGIKGCRTDPDGLCDLDTFIAGMQQRIKEVDFTFDCFGNYTIPIPDKIVDGQFPNNLRK
ncbi:phosphoglycerate mutase-like protein [Pholiota conissans]|uniref:Phosphoglycerate mutase-like protein n=1 Tax=Pholiota conissans TaxID=109636 RepID=A0A9P6CP13_9AGAR|nr:phosphoglycerate mutase-like protein [Pholiota conissans]